MKRLLKWRKRVLSPLLLACAVCLVCSCASVSVNKESLPPILTQEELLRPYDKVAEIVVHRNRFGLPADLTSSDYSWAYQTLREEAAKLGADAVILPELKMETQTYDLFPTNSMRAKGLAIRFR